jgi:hypothetical protein
VLTGCAPFVGGVSVQRPRISRNAAPAALPVRDLSHLECQACPGCWPRSTPSERENLMMSEPILEAAAQEIAEATSSRGEVNLGAGAGR